MSTSRVHWNSLGWALAATACLVAALWLVFPPLYLTNDDVTMRLGIEGHAVPEQPPTGFVLMTHSALAWALVGLQQMLPSVPLWDVLLTGTLVCALAVLIAIIWATDPPGGLPRFAALFALLAAAVPLLSGVQFTISATLAGGASVALALVELDSQRRRTSVLVAAGILFLTGLLIRPMGALCGALASSALLVRTPIRHRASVLVVAAGVFGLALLADGAIYRTSSAWDNYNRYNWMTARLFEWGGELPARDVEAIRSSVGWSLNDWRMLQAFWGVDPDLHGFDRVAKAYARRVELVGWEEWLRWLAGRLIAVDRSTLQDLVGQSAPIWIAGAIYVAAYARRRQAGAAALAVVLFTIFCIAIAAAFKELPFRLLAPLQVCALAAVVVVAGRHRRDLSPLLSIITVSLLLTILAREVQVVASELRADGAHSSQVRGEVESLRQLKPSLIVLHSDAFPSEHWWRPFHSTATGLPAIQLGGNNQNPLLQNFLAHGGPQPLLRRMCEDPSILVVSQPGRLEFVTTYLREHFDLQADWEEVYSGSFRAWRCIASQ